MSMPTNDHSSSNQSTHLYVPHRQRELGWRVWVEMAAELFQARELLWRLIWRDVVARYKQSMLGIFSGMNTPLAMMMVFSYLHHSKVIAHTASTTIPYPLYAYFGLLIWQMTSTGLSRATSSLVIASNLVGKVQFPRETLVLSSLGVAVFDLCLGLPALGFLLVYYDHPLHWTVLVIPLVLIIQLILISGLGMILSVMNAAMRDIGHFLPAFLLFWMFLTPIVYHPPETPFWRLLSWINPITALVTTTRDLALVGTIKWSIPIFTSSLISLLIGLTGWRVFHQLEPRIAERV